MSLNYVVQDLMSSLHQWRFWSTLAWNDILKQYRRSFLGPIWIALNTAIFIVAFGLIGAQLFKIDVAIYLPLFAIGHVFFTFFSAVMQEGCSTFIQAEGYLKHAASPKFIHIFRGVLRIYFVLGHNLVIIFLVLWWFDRLVLINLAPFLLALLLFALQACVAMAAVATICARFRDVPMMITSLMQVLFFVTPVMWQPEQLTERAQWLVRLNPFAIYLEVVRQPLLGKAVPFEIYASALGVLGISLISSIVIFSWGRKKIVYWL